jgi:hypothetical protein
MTNENAAGLHRTRSTLAPPPRSVWRMCGKQLNSLMRVHEVASLSTNSAKQPRDEQPPKSGRAGKNTNGLRDIRSSNQQRKGETNPSRSRLLRSFAGRCADDANVHER